MPKVSPAVVTLLRHVAATVAGRRVYLSFGERSHLVAAVAQFDPGYCAATLEEDLIFRGVEQLRAALAAVASIGGSDAVYAVVGAIQIAEADGRFDDEDLALVHLVSDAVGLSRARVDGAISRIDAPARPIGDARVSPMI
ncbi:MAG: hypothetical protein IT196_11110 [Acidimicrobiales bacterium]|nr:hypothetical protein [Acidimicrobiales bacterium]